MRKRNANSEKSQNRINRVVVFTAGLLVLSLLAGGCSTVSYYGQSIVGHTRLMFDREPLEEVLREANENGDHELAGKLLLAQELREFAIKDLSLPDNGSYQQYVDLKREYPVWTVVAAQEFSLAPKKWCYLIIGCASYRGYFAQNAADEYAKSLQGKGFDVAVGGASAYSTLGWFDDPLLPSMMRYGEAVFAETLFHELAHQVLYINGESDLNEAFATAVGEHGAQLWLRAHRPDKLELYMQSLEANYDFAELLLNTRRKLSELYGADLTLVQKRQGKEQLFRALKIDYQALIDQRWAGIGWFDGWFKAPLNNARVAAVATYRDRVPEFNALMESCEFDFKRFFVTLEKRTKAGGHFLVPKVCDQAS